MNKHSVCNHLKMNRIAWNLSVAVFIGLVVIFVMIPFYWDVSTSLKRETDVISSVIKYFPAPITFENYIKVWNASKFSLFFSNSLFISLVSTVVIVILSVFNAYAIDRFKFKGRNIFILVQICTQLLPVTMVIVPLIIIFKKIGIINTLFSLILVNITIQIPFNTLLSIGFVEGIPKQIDEAAMVDGAARLRIIFTIIMPVMLPGLVAISSFAFIGCWNEFILAFSLTSSLHNYTIPIGLKSMIGQYNIEYASLAAGSIIALIPPVLLFSVIQKYLVQGLSGGSVKG